MTRFVAIICYYTGLYSLFCWLNRKAKRIIKFHNVLLPKDGFGQRTEKFNGNLNNSLFENVTFRDIAFEHKLLEKLCNGVSVKIDGEDWNMQFPKGKKITLSGDGLKKAADGINNPLYLNGKDIHLDADFGNLDLRIEHSVVELIRNNLSGVDVLVSNCYDSNLARDKKARYHAFVSLNVSCSMLNFRFIFECRGADAMCRTIRINDSIKFYASITMSYNGHEYIIYDGDPLKNNGCHYLVIEGTDAVNIDEFNEESFKILKALSFVCGRFCYGLRFVFEYGENQYSKLASISLMSTVEGDIAYQPLTMDSHSFFSENDNKVTNPIDKKILEGQKNALNGRLCAITRPQFEGLLREMDNDVFNDLVTTLIEASLPGRAMTQSARVVLYAACLEIAAEWADAYVEKHPEKKPASVVAGQLLSKHARKEIRKLFREILERYTEEDAQQIKRIDAKICSDLFRAPNADALELPYKVFGVKLTLRDKWVLRKRNDVLHGRMHREPPTTETEAMRCYFHDERQCYAFYSLLWRLIMKVVGYEGVIKDIARCNEYNHYGRSHRLKPFAIWN